MLVSLSPWVKSTKATPENQLVWNKRLHCSSFIKSYYSKGIKLPLIANL